MNTKNKITTFLALCAGGATATALLNQYIKVPAISRRLITSEESLCYRWRLGAVYYTKKGTGKPLLLIHDLNFASSGQEWSQLVDRISQNYTVYTLDLLGCGRSEKPNLTYTNYLFVQLLTDFVKSEIGHRTNLIASGESSSFSVMACCQSPELFDRILLINPSSLSDCAQIPGKNSKLYKLILDLPIVGTLLCNIAGSRKMITEKFQKEYYYNPYAVKAALVDAYYEAAHLGDYPKALFSSLECLYTKCNITNALKKIDNSIFIAGGSEEPSIEDIIAEYRKHNSAVEFSLIPKTKHLPQLEDPAKLMELIEVFFA